MAAYRPRLSSKRWTEQAPKYECATDTHRTDADEEAIKNIGSPSEIHGYHNTETIGS